jgi:hypothetical protein
MVEQVKKIEEVKPGDFLKVTQLDKSVPVSNRLNFTGKVVKTYKHKLHSAWIVEVRTFDFLTGLEFDTESFEYIKLSRAPSGWAKFEKTGKSPNETKLKKAKPVKTHKQKVFDLVKDNPRKQLKGLLSLAKREIGGDEVRLKLEIQLAMGKLRGS